MQQHHRDQSTQLQRARFGQHVPNFSGPMPFTQRKRKTEPETTTEEMWARLQRGDSLREDISPIKLVQTRPTACVWVLRVVTAGPGVLPCGPDKRGVIPIWRPRCNVNTTYTDSKTTRASLALASDKMCSWALAEMWFPPRGAWETIRSEPQSQISFAHDSPLPEDVAQRLQPCASGHTCTDNASVKIDWLWNVSARGHQPLANWVGILHSGSGPHQ